MTDRLEPPSDAEAIRDEQVSRALGRLTDGGELTPQQRATVERLADRLTGELLAMFDAERPPPEDADAGDGERRILCPD